MPYIAIPTNVAQLIRVTIKENEEIETFTAESPDLNIFVTGKSLDDEFHKGIKRAIRDNFSAMGQTPPMTILRVNHPWQRQEGYWYFVAIPKSALMEEIN